MKRPSSSRSQPKSLPQTLPGRRSASQSPPSEISGLAGWFQLRTLGYTLTGLWAAIAATAVAADLGIVDLLERQGQTLFFEMRGPVIPPSDVVILAIDEASLTQQQFYQADPERYSALEPIQTWPWKRAAYATAINRIMDAGARAIAFDIIFSTPSSYGPEDDAVFSEALQNHADRVVLASQYTDVATPQGVTTQYVQSIADFQPSGLLTGFINFYLEPDGRIHRFGEQFVTELIRNAPPFQVEAYELLSHNTQSFAVATLDVSQHVALSNSNSIFFYGPSQTFEQIPFWYVLDDDSWTNALQSGAYFKDKIVVVGSVAAVHQDFHAAPFSKTWFYPQAMAGVEIQANAIATLLQNRSITEAIPQAPVRGILVLVLLIGAGWVIGRPRQALNRWLVAMGLAIAWGGIGYVAFIHGRTIIPTTVPIVAIALSGFSQLVTGVAKDQRSKQQLREALRRHVTSPVIQEILNEQEGFQDLIQERQKALAGTLLSGRYQIVKVLGAGGFSETYIAEDILRPGKPRCVVKQLRVLRENPKAHEFAHRLFTTEAETLERLGQHDRIPLLLASFEEAQQFYLVQQFISGHLLSHELLPHRVFSEADVIVMLYEILQILDFVHQHGIIHRDLKPANLIRRDIDARLVMIDFGVAKRITTQLANMEQDAKFTIAVGTPGYMPPEQLAGKPRYNSDIYALGVIGIEAVTGQPASAFPPDPETGLMPWQSSAPQLTKEFTALLARMVEPDPTLRFSTAKAVQETLQTLPTYPEEAIRFVTAQAPTPSTVPQDNLASEAEAEAQADVNTAALPNDWYDTTIASNENAQISDFSDDTAFLE
ncbi:MAG: CHASE2 domain-containing protein [Synechococcales cyanobacterium T60_A2020_003]|nr:CHASE2 domain-containing protein [Synechococcales cyanobacterium T60_A2020_003]